VSVLVTYGTDHHRFDRLSRWIEDWLATRPGVRCAAQEGASRPPQGALALGLVAREELLAHMRQATVVVGQAGPGTVIDAHQCGVLPLLVPRLPALDEVVDDHQVAFARTMAASGRALVAESAGELWELLDAVAADPAMVRTPAASADLVDVGRQLAQLCDDVLGRPAGWVHLGRVVEMARSRRRR
jgi:UDP-N-acetylglucosamine transferase subunit ALG13